MATTKTFIINVDHLKTEEDVKKIKTYFKDNLDGIEQLDINLNLQIITVTYTESVGSPKYILDAFNHLGYTVR